MRETLMRFISDEGIALVEDANKAAAAESDAMRHQVIKLLEFGRMAGLFSDAALAPGAEANNLRLLPGNQ